jgi:hypothetical protein
VVGQHMVRQYLGRVRLELSTNGMCSGFEHRVIEIPGETKLSTTHSF